MEVITTTYSVVTSTLPNGHVVAIGFYYSTGDLVIAGLLLVILLVQVLWCVYNVIMQLTRLGRRPVSNE